MINWICVSWICYKFLFLFIFSFSSVTSFYFYFYLACFTILTIFSFISLKFYDLSFVAEEQGLCWKLVFEFLQIILGFERLQRYFCNAVLTGIKFIHSFKEKIPHLCESIGHRPLQSRCPASPSTSSTTY